ncbi:hypothetical protein Ga0061065_11077 [Marinomonas fungiae]|uniref:Uncharacterized protein n=1 Tax=Marinomonas fungiae TaxID=1137284 RepID=A0A0K6IQJ6_9GAMM|nr:hypothetical protein Ga0061065_11077 [Marinomonas fungiae]
MFEDNEIFKTIGLMLGIILSTYFMITFVYMRVSQMPPLPWGLY